MPKPSELFVGILDFFAVLLPGAILTGIIAPNLAPLIFGPLVPMPTSELGVWSVFLATSYFLGHFTFFLGSYIDPVYNRIRKWRNPYNNTSAYHSATLVRNEILQAHELQALNTFQWSRSVLLTTCPIAADDVHRLEADSKFFRSILVVCLVAAAIFALKEKYSEAALAVILIFPCFARYYERRLKSTTQAYIHVVTLRRLGKIAPPTHSERGDA